MSDSNFQNSNLQSVEILGLIKSERYSTAIEKVRVAVEQGIQLYVDPELLSNAFDNVIAKTREERELLEVINLYHEKFNLTSNELSDREGYFDSLILHLKEIKDELSKHDWKEITSILNWQNNYLKLIGGERNLIGQLELAISQCIEYEKKAARINESEVEGFIQETKTTFLKALPSEESLDYAAQIILNSKSWH